MTAEEFLRKEYPNKRTPFVEYYDTEEVIELVEAYANYVVSEKTAEQLSQKESQVDSGTTYTKQEILDLLPTDDEIRKQYNSEKEDAFGATLHISGAAWMRDEIVRRLTNQEVK